ncbi:unnamed protein product, partial [Prorocentrum cordatum]
FTTAAFHIPGQHGAAPRRARRVPRRTGGRLAGGRRSRAPAAGRRRRDRRRGRRRGLLRPRPRPGGSDSVDGEGKPGRKRRARSVRRSDLEARTAFIDEAIPVLERERPASFKVKTQQL